MPKNAIINLTGMDLFEKEVLALKATADRRLELLKDAVELLYVICDHYQVNEITTGEMIERIEKELSDGNNE